jgi:hypothetical protein
MTAMYFIVTRAADSAAKAPTYDLALSSVNRVVEDLEHSTTWGLTGLKPGAITDVHLYVDEHVIASGESNVIGPDEPLRQSIAPAINTYEYEVRGSCSFQPILPGSDLPLLGKIPMLSEPAILTAKAVRAVEFPDGLTCQ